MVWVKCVIILTGLFPGLLQASEQQPGLHRAVASLRQKGRLPAHGTKGKGLKTDIGNLDLFDPLKDTVEATVAAAIANAKAHPRKHTVSAANTPVASLAKNALHASTKVRIDTVKDNRTSRVVASSANHHQSLAHKVRQVTAERIAKNEPEPMVPKRIAKNEPKPMVPKRTPRTDRQQQRDAATRQSVDQAQKVKFPVVQQEAAPQDVPAEHESREQAPSSQKNGKLDPCRDGAEIAEKVVQAFPHMQQQPIWNLVGPDVLHLGQIVDEKLSDVKDWLSPVGDQLLDKFPNLRLRDLPVFCSLPKPFPRHFAWAQPLEVTASGLANFFPFHVRNTPLQSLRLEDMVLVGRRQRELAEQNYQREEKIWEKHVRKSNFRAVIKDKQYAIDELSAKTKEVTKAYDELQTLYGQGTVELNKFQSRFDEDQKTLDLQRNLLAAENAKVAQLEAVKKEIKDDLVDRRESDEEHKEKELKAILELKEKTTETLRQQLRDLRATLDKDRELENRKMEEQQAVIANVTEVHRKAENEADALQRRVEELKARIAAEARDKARLEKENKDLADENQRLSGQNAQLSGLEDQLQSEGDSLEKEVKHDRIERDRLQKDIDNLEASEHAEDTKDAETASLTNDAPKSTKDVQAPVAQNLTENRIHPESKDGDDDDDDSDEADF